MTLRGVTEDSGVREPLLKVEDTYKPQFCLADVDDDHLPNP